jgi:2'-5' RNA ligase
LTRLFLSIPIPEDVCQSLSPLQQGLDKAKWNPLTKMHITLRFIGEVKEEDVETIIQSLKGLRYGDFKLALSNLGTFSNDHGQPLVLWAGVNDKEPLKALNELINKALKNIPLPVTTHFEFAPHITLAEFKDARKSDLDDYLKAHKDFSSKEFTVDSFSLFKSSEKPGAPYTALHTYKLQPSVPRPAVQRPRP